MKFKHWVLWYAFVIIGIAGKISKAIPLQQSLSRSEIWDFLTPFVLGTIGTALAILWANGEDV